MLTKVRSLDTLLSTVRPGQYLCVEIDGGEFRGYVRAVSESEVRIGKLTGDESDCLSLNPSKGTLDGYSALSYRIIPKPRSSRPRRVNRTREYELPEDVQIPNHPFFFSSLREVLREEEADAERERRRGRKNESDDYLRSSVFGSDDDFG